MFFQGKRMENNYCHFLQSTVQIQLKLMRGKI